MFSVFLNSPTYSVCMFLPYNFFHSISHCSPTLSLWNVKSLWNSPFGAFIFKSACVLVFYLAGCMTNCSLVSSLTIFLCCLLVGLCVESCGAGAGADVAGDSWPFAKPHRCRAPFSHGSAEEPLPTLQKQGWYGLVKDFPLQLSVFYYNLMCKTSQPRFQHSGKENI